MPSIQAYKDLHYGEDNTDYSSSLSDLEIVDWLDGRISRAYQTPMKREQILRMGEKWRRTVYNNMKASNNLGSIMKIKGEDLGITDTDKYCYLLTYSFPCQDLSSAGKGAGMEKGSGTRSELLWEVERLLAEISGYIPHRVPPNGKIFSATKFVDNYNPADSKKLPQILLMENVPEVVGKKNMPQFAKWLAFLDELGYKTKWDILNAKDFGIPQNRARCFAVSVLGDYYYDMPKGFPLKKRLKDVLEKNVDESYYLKEETIQALNLKEKDISKSVRVGGRGSVDRHEWDCVLEKTTIMSRPHGYNEGGFAETDIFPTIRESSTIDGNNGVVEWKK